uniref:Secreted protein n=1 Tax=Haemonchus placei TaxID=6290 RepID=A0A0N4WJR0_HAEPC
LIPARVERKPKVASTLRGFSFAAFWIQEESCTTNCSWKAIPSPLPVTLVSCRNLRNPFEKNCLDELRCSSSMTGSSHRQINLCKISVLSLLPQITPCSGTSRLS